MFCRFRLCGKVAVEGFWRHGIVYCNADISIALHKIRELTFDARYADLDKAQENLPFSGLQVDLHTNGRA